MGRFVKDVKQGTRAIESVTLRIARTSRIAGSNGDDAFLLPSWFIENDGRGAERPSD